MKIVLLAATLIAITPNVNAQEFLKPFLDESGLHFGTDDNPNKCCYCKEVVDTRFENKILEYGYKTNGNLNWIHPDIEFYSPDGKTWICPPLGRAGSDGYIPSCLLSIPTG